MPDIEEEKRLRAEMTEEEWEFHLQLRKQGEEIRKAMEKNGLSAEAEARIIANVKKKYEEYLAEEEEKKRKGRKSVQMRLLKTLKTKLFKK